MIKPNYIEFNAGEHPTLPFEGHKFLRFSSKISGRGSEEAKEYINTVARMAQLSFGSRVQHWSEMYDQYGHYGWKEVHESIKSYEQVSLQFPIVVSNRRFCACSFCLIHLFLFARVT
jgi:hypothetical protein